MHFGTKQKYRVPQKLIEYLCEWNRQTEPVVRMVHHLRKLQLKPPSSGGDIEGDEMDEPTLSESELLSLAETLLQHEPNEAECNSIIQHNQSAEGAEVENYRAAIFKDYEKTAFSTGTSGDPPKRFEFGEAEINLKADAVPLKQRMFQIQGERRDAWTKLTNELIAQGKLEESVSPWNSPSFPVAKKRAGNLQVSRRLQAVNEATITDGHPLPLINDIIQKQAKYKMFSVLDMITGFHQVPLKKEHRYITSMSTPAGSKQWKVLVMGLKNAGAQFQRVMEHILEGLPFASVYIDDIIIGSTGETEQEILANHDKNVCAVLDRLAQYQMFASKKKAHLFVKEVEFCGHILREGTRRPAPGKLLSIQKWEVPKTITQLRGFLGLTNYYSCYVRDYATFAGPLTEKLKVNRNDEKKGSTMALKWSESEKLSFENLKKALLESLELFCLDPEKPFVLRCDASDRAIGAVLEQARFVKGEEKWVPVGFFSRKLGKPQYNWTPREKETYAIVSALRKWAGLIGLQPVLITTDHKSLDDWVNEKLTPPQDRQRAERVGTRLCPNLT